MKKAGEHIRVNFGQSPFVFDIDGMMSASNNFYLSRIFSSLGFIQVASAAAPGSATVLGLDPPTGSVSANDIVGLDDSIANGFVAAMLEGPTLVEHPGARAGIALMAPRETFSRSSLISDPSIAEQPIESAATTLNSLRHPVVRHEEFVMSIPSTWTFRRLSIPESLPELVPDPSEFSAVMDSITVDSAVLPGPEDSIQSSAAERQIIPLLFPSMISHRALRLQQITHDTAADDLQRERKQIMQDIEATRYEKLSSAH
jgi:hypothetical protein